MGIPYVGTRPSNMGDIQTAVFYTSSAQVDAVRNNELGYFRTNAPDTFFGTGISGAYDGDFVTIVIETHVVQYASGSAGNADELRQFATVAYGWMHAKLSRIQYIPSDGGVWGPWSLVKPTADSLRPNIGYAHNLGLGLGSNASGSVTVVSGTNENTFTLYSYSAAEVGVYHDFVIQGVIGNKIILTSGTATVNGAGTSYTIPLDAKWVRFILVAENVWHAIPIRPDALEAAKAYSDASMGNLKLVKLTQAAYDGLSVKNSNTVYYIVG